MQSDLAEKDSLTDTFNKTFFYKYINKLNKNKESNQNLAAIKINLINLLIVNNKLGHAIGDEMLINTARLLKKSFLKKGIIIRTDINEFLILIHSVDKYELDMLIFNMNKTIYLYNKRSNKPYKIKFNFSYALYNNEFHTFDEFFDYLKIKMYENNNSLI
ncbi:GGDEF domain-containing protein [Clostridium weizhouense]|uniref:Diguanylate cyclase n=1 Tax=Clostridium weizhouense TaxID=2859781 RepID=A0ABS7ATP0_9CLOT|nr:diguanylate cyclase [Clostridium weizhouense]MBW6410880.1 diguanylate cyclase [Clostridium weizhouense]